MSFLLQATIWGEKKTKKTTQDLSGEVAYLKDKLRTADEKVSLRMQCWLAGKGWDD